AAANATPSVMRAPNNNRLKISLPSWSVPIQWVSDGGWSRSTSRCEIGSLGASRGPAIATSVIMLTIAAPNTATCLRANERAIPPAEGRAVGGPNELPQLDTRVEIAIQDIDK